MRDKYGVAQDSYCYPNSDVLVNKLNITNADELAKAELEFTAFRYSEYTSNIKSLDEFNLNHLQHLHWYLFQDVYAWAGEIRTVDISKGDTRFCTCSRIDVEVKKQFQQIGSLDINADKAELLVQLADIYCELNIIHPFREGNGRTQRFFFEELLFFLGMIVNWPDISKDEWVQANIDGYYGNLNPLYKILTLATR
ncbi:Fic family protein [Pseudoalteromonas sp. L23]|uniref:Fic/DOC family protein n=1 Tax=unclassified Pseudoalteromonas TaxID=194690 RepID=UPI001EEFB0B6|nr:MULTISPECIES: Fic family protein [unclassified Pseudoalteromonas]MCF7516560.1 Fic family protein [Pseudoalteromonas sp. L7]MCF7528343.1 Fic family protein [Pseudoalteromonas sp. L23]MCX2769751.1 Fic family protein [Pseudoalteromonas sp. B530]